MKKVLLVAGFALLSIGVGAQVGINAGEDPKGTLQVGYTSDWSPTKPQTVSFPSVSIAVRKKWTDVKEGMMIYNTTEHCLEVFNGSEWRCVQDIGKEGFEYNGKWYNGDEYVKDRHFGDGEHDFIYKVITGPNGKKWLNLNLGADYANVHSRYFNPDQQATSRWDYHAYGSLFQWQRKADGHELITWNSATSGTPKQGTTNTLASTWANAGTSKFIIGEYNWVRNGSSDTSGPNVLLWRANGANNPCPVGYHVPTKAEWVAYHKAVIGLERNTNGKFWNGFNADILRLPAVGFRDSGNGSLYYQGSSRGSGCWSSESYNGNSESYDFGNVWSFDFNSDASGVSYLYYYRASGASVRCLQD